MREWRRCSGCGFTKFGACPVCFPDLAEAELQLELSEQRWRDAEEERRSAGVLFCHDHGWRDGCWQRARPERRVLTWGEAMRQLRERYVPPG